MLKSCTYCGHIHDSKHDCGKKPKRAKKATDKDRFRWTQAWQKKREEIRRRDLYLCQICIRELYDTYIQYNYSYLEVHHVVPLEIDYSKRLDNDNLLTMCERHHEMAERGEISLEEVLNIAKEQACKA